MKTLTIVALLLTLLSGCHGGPQIENFVPARTPDGLMIDIALPSKLVPGNHLAGELLDVREDGLLVLREPATAGPAGSGTVSLVPYASIRTVRAHDLPSLRVNCHGHPPKQEAVGQLKLMSRFPQGVSPELLASLLAAHSQEQVEEIAAIR